MGAIHQALLGLHVPAGAGPTFPAFPSVTNEWGRYEVFRETGYSNGNGIEPLTDWSGNTRHWTHSGTDASRPQYETGAGPNSQPVANGDHPNNLGWNTGPDMSALTAAHFFAVMKAKADPAADIGDTGFWNFGTDALSAHVPYVDGNVYDDAGTTARKTAGNPATSLASAFRLYEVISTSSEWTLLVDGTQVFTTATNTVGCPAAPTLLFNAGASSRHKLAAVYIFSAKKSGADRTAIIDYLNDPDIFATSYS
jgi:hypothetical protein